jgi:hypothetical protein
VWNATPALTEEAGFAVPMTEPSLRVDEPVWVGGVGGEAEDKDMERCPGDSGGRGEKEFEFISPIYDDLDTNIPYSLMEYSDYRFGAGTPLFPRHERVLGYLEGYADADADAVRGLVRFGVQVLDVRPVGGAGAGAGAGEGREGGERWAVRTREIGSGDEITKEFDAVIVANGHYDTPFVPDIPGIAEWNRMYPGEISHSKFYRRVDGFRDKVRLCAIRYLVLECRIGR